MRNIKTRLAACLLLAAWPVLAAAGATQPKPGDIPPDALGKDRSGAPVTVSQHRGKVVIVTFWASWCGPCRSELPLLGRLQKTVGRDHLEVIAVNYKEPKRDFVGVVRANKDLALTYVHDARGTTSDRYGVQVLPNMFVIAPDGRVAHVHRGYSAEMLDGFIREMLALLPAEVLDRPAGG